MKVLNYILGLLDEVYELTIQGIANHPKIAFWVSFALLALVIAAHV